jgi:hypothetical protein
MIAERKKLTRRHFRKSGRNRRPSGGRRNRGAGKRIDTEIVFKPRNQNRESQRVETCVVEREIVVKLRQGDLLLSSTLPTWIAFSAGIVSHEIRHQGERAPPNATTSTSTLVGKHLACS